MHGGHKVLYNLLCSLWALAFGKESFKDEVSDKHACVNVRSGFLNSSI